MAVGNVPEGLHLGPKIPIFQANHLQARFLRCRGDTTCQAPDPRWQAGEGTGFETVDCDSPPRPSSRASRATGKPCLETGGCDNAAEPPASIRSNARHFLDAGCLTSRSGRTRVIGPDRRHGFGRRQTPDLRLANFLRASNCIDTGGWNTNGSRSVTTAGVCKRSMQIGFGERPGPDAAGHRGAMGCNDWVVRHLPVVGDGRLRASACQPCPGRFQSSAEYGCAVE